MASTSTYVNLDIGRYTASKSSHKILRNVSIDLSEEEDNSDHLRKLVWEKHNQRCRQHLLCRHRHCWRRGRWRANRPDRIFSNVSKTAGIHADPFETPLTQ